VDFSIFRRGRILNIAHRGSETRAPENTLAAFRLAIYEGADGVELDVQPTRDGHLVALHDLRVDRTTDGRGKVFCKTLAQVKQLDAGSWFSPQYAGERVPTLDDVFDALPQHAILAIELKSLRPTAFVPQKVIETIRKYDAEDRVLLLSYNPIALWHCKRLAPEIPVKLNHQPDKREYIIQFFRHIVRFAPDARSFDISVLRRHPKLVGAHQLKGTRVFSGVMHREARECPEAHMRFLRDLGVDGIMASDPMLLKKVLDEKK